MSHGHVIKCSGAGCPISESCLRKTEPEVRYQTWENHAYDHQRELCRWYWPVDDGPPAAE